MLRALVDRIRAQSGGRALLALVGGTAMAQVITLASTPILSRLYGPAAMGELGLFAAFLGVAGLLVTARYELAIPGARDEADAALLLRLSMRLAVILSIASALALVVLRARAWLTFELLPWWAALVAVPALIAFGWFSALRYWHLRRRDYDGIARVVVVQSGGRAIASIGLGMVSGSSAGLLAGEVIGRVLGVTRLLSRLRLDESWRASAGRPTGETASRHRSFPALLLPSGLLDVLALSLPVPLISSTYGVAAAGTFLMVQRLSLLPAALVAGGAGDVLHVGIVEALAAGGGAARALLGRAALRLLGAALVVFLPAAALAPWVLPRFLGPAWVTATPLFLALLPWSAANLVVSPLSRVLAVSDRKHLKLVYDVVALGALVGATLFGARAGWGLTTTIAFVGALQVVAYALYFALIRAACPPARADGAVPPLVTPE